VLLIFAIAVVTAPLGLSVGGSVKYMLEHFIPNLVYFGLLVVAVRHAGDLRLIVGAYVLSLGILVYLSLFVWEFMTFNGFQRMHSPNMYDANDLGAVFAAGMPLCLLLAQTSKGWSRWLGYGVAAGAPATIAMTGSRGGFLALLVTGIGLLVMMPKVTWRQRIGVIVTAVLVMALAAPEGYLSKMNTIVNADEDYNLTDEVGRVAIWKRGLGYLAPRPLNGVGIGNFVRAQWENPGISANGEGIRAMSAHNTFLQLGVELGIPAFLVYISILVGGTIGLARIRARLPRSWLEESAQRRFIYMACSYLPVSFAGWAAGAFFVSHAYLPPYYILIAYMAGTLILLRREKKADQARARLARQAAAAAG
jgi:O-antigen ligase